MPQIPSGFGQNLGILFFCGGQAAERLGLRREKAEPIVDGLKEGIESARASALPRSALGKACDYALGRWGQLRRFLDYGQLKLSNNLAENAIRPVAVGRKNWLHVGSERAGPRVAAIIYGSWDNNHGNWVKKGPTAQVPMFIADKLAR